MMVGGMSGSNSHMAATSTQLNYTLLDQSRDANEIKFFNFI